MKFSSAFIAVLLAGASSKVPRALATISKNGIVSNGAFNIDETGWTIETNRNGVIVPEADETAPSTGPSREIGWHWNKKRMQDGTIAPHFGILSQVITSLIPNGWYTLSFAAYHDNSDTDHDYFLRVLLDSTQISDGPTIQLQNLVITQEIKFQAPASAAGGVRLSFESQNNAGSVFVDEIGITPLLTASQAASKSKRRLASKRDQLCSKPSEKACPLEEWGYRLDLASNEGVLRKVGWECVEVDQDLESCGGCATIPGEGINCLEIPGVNELGVSCHSGQCIIDSCIDGYALSWDRSSCLKL